MKIGIVLTQPVSLEQLTKAKVPIVKIRETNLLAGSVIDKATALKLGLPLGFSIIEAKSDGQKYVSFEVPTTYTADVEWDEDNSTWAVETVTE